MGLLQYTGSVLLDLKCCVRELWRSSTTSFNATSIAHNQDTNICPYAARNFHEYLSYTHPNTQINVLVLRYGFNGWQRRFEGQDSLVVKSDPESAETL